MSATEQAETRGLFGAERASAFIDAVVAIAMTLLILPLMESVSDIGDAGGTTLLWLAEHEQQLVSFVLSFVIIAMFWMFHHRLFVLVEAITSGLMWLLVGWLLTIVWLPVATAITGAMDDDDNLVKIVYVGSMIATAFFSLSCLASVAQLWALRRKKPTTAKSARSLLPSPDDLERFTYRLIIIGFILWTFTLIAGAIWAQRAWGRFWGWDVKEVWTFIIWVLYAAYIHAKATRGWSGRAAAWLAIVGYAAVIFNFGVVNVFFKGLHSYSGL